jgi:uncharacterized protein YlxW (UPF0749 family)
MTRFKGILRDNSYVFAYALIVMAMLAGFFALQAQEDKLSSESARRKVALNAVLDQRCDRLNTVTKAVRDLHQALYASEVEKKHKSAAVVRLLAILHKDLPLLREENCRATARKLNLG